jgi:hypothetical protein
MYGNRAWYNKELLDLGLPTWILYGDGTMTNAPADWIGPDANNVFRWVGDRGDGVAWEWEFHPAVISRLGGIVWWRADFKCLWNAHTEDEVLPPAWMPERPGMNQWCRWRATLLPMMKKKDGSAHGRAIQAVRIDVVRLAVLPGEFVRWYAEGRAFDTWPPRFRVP